MPMNYYGPREERMKLIEIGTIWFPREENQDSKARLKPIRILGIHPIPDLPKKEHLLSYELIDPTTKEKIALEKGMRKFSKMSFHSLLSGFHREGEQKFSERPKYQQERKEPDFNERMLVKLHQRVINIENFLKTLGYEV